MLHRFSVTTAVGFAFGLASFLLVAEAGERVKGKTATITEGDLKVTFRDNARSPDVLSGVAALFHQKDSPDFPAFNPAREGELNFEHIISGHKNPNNSFTPRKGKLELVALPDGQSAKLVRKKEAEPWAMSSTIKYTVVKRHYIDMDFRRTPHDAALFGKRGYAILFFANYMHHVDESQTDYSNPDHVRISWQLLCL